jgi:hypothetical protein
MVTHATHPERLRDILVHVFLEMAMRYSGNRVERTYFETFNDEELHLAFFRTVNEMLVRWGRLQDQLGNTVVGMLGCVYSSTQCFPESCLRYPASRVY